ncbi:carboxylating nicotinate-nucleotide diphosphorylase [Roseiconus lacunae]|uniref:carboxylating nicotinate-nucleotide diphosphorylase n=1 Tax=Roseiconus lacunae TaxID=2605694 RepID=UPI001E37E60E|nr:carboxylating nicotinate-nucleotide diphosphorylase [Roseiconus lacunae]MCD0462681.1 carboxylating nicotinate-nucleotide diphosphorylase [Roseiconus lacunae]WRQ51190.1 carboxylating nicotinate-nucleotide diphosphorylase [Stieleria sp. HD01]
MQDYATVTADAALENDVRLLVRLAIAEDLAGAIDWTTVCMIDDDVDGGCQITPRGDGICAGLAILPWIIDEFDADLQSEVFLRDGEPLVPGKPIAKLRGNVRDLLTSERTILNLLSRTCGVATLVRQYVDAIEGSSAHVYDTRKTTPGWRLLEKYAVACGGGRNHRRGLYDGFLIKDNHLQLGGNDGVPMPASEAARKAIQWRGGQVEHLTAPSMVEIEVDSLDQLRDVLPTGPDIVLIDNFSLEDIRSAVQMRNQINTAVELEVSGNVKLDTIVEIAKTGVERISSGALTHQATWLDLGFDWFDTRDKTES